MLQELLQILKTAAVIVVCLSVVIINYFFVVAVDWNCELFCLEID